MIVYKPLAPIRAITFDLDDTLYDNMPYIHLAEASLREFMAEHYPITNKLTQEDWQHIRIATLKEQPELKNDIGNFRATVLTKGFIQVGLQADDIPQAVTACFDHFYHTRSDFKVSKKARKVLKKLSKRVALAAITNGNVDCKAIGIAPFFSHIVHASPEYPMKPSRAMFDLSSKALDIPAKNILHVGDDLDKDIRGAIEAGYQTAWLAVNRPMHLRNERVSVLPHIQLDSLRELKKLVRKTS